MPRAGEQVITWMPAIEVVKLFENSYGSKAREIIRVRGLITGAVPWDCDELIGKKRSSDPDKGDPRFWRRESKLVGLVWPRGEENTAHRREVAYAQYHRLQVLCDYWAFGIRFGREGAISLLPPSHPVRLSTWALTDWPANTPLNNERFVYHVAKRMCDAGCIAPGRPLPPFKKQLAEAVVELLEVIAPLHPSLSPITVGTAENYLRHLPYPPPPLNQP